VSDIGSVVPSGCEMYTIIRSVELYDAIVRFDYTEQLTRRRGSVMKYFRRWFFTDGSVTWSPRIYEDTNYGGIEDVRSRIGPLELLRREHDVIVVGARPSALKRSANTIFKSAEPGHRACARDGKLSAVHILREKKIRKHILQTFVYRVVLHLLSWSIPPSALHFGFVLFFRTHPSPRRMQKYLSIFSVLRIIMIVKHNQNKKKPVSSMHS